MSLKQRLLSEDKPLFGAFLNISSPNLVEMIGFAGYDFCIIDTEHGSFNNQRIEDCLRAATAAGIPCLVRLSKLDGHQIQAALDMGADGVQVPQVDTVEQARAAVEFGCFPPNGVRGYGSTTRDAKYGFLTRAETIEKAKLEKVSVIQIESQEGINNLKEILNIPGIDIIFIGTGDLSLSLGYGSAGDPRILELLKKVIPEICAAGKVAGVHISDWSWLDSLIGLGARYFTVSAVAVIKDAFKSNVQNFRTQEKV